MKPHRSPKLLSEISHLRTAQQDVERATRSFPFSCDEMFHHGLLFRRHFIPLERLEAVADKLDIFSRRSLSLRRAECRGKQADNNEHPMLHRKSPFRS